MTLQLLHYEFPYICGNFFVFYQCTREEREGALTEGTVFQVFIENPTFAPPPPQGAGGAEGGEVSICIGEEK